ncbi:hypothetical protein ALQ89_100983 [Pseudomonas amygdali pv. tabaci]|uniref:Uncharacterized protein n=10 Tax=Pseudomonas syringae group TaxID=136849 RepID=A0AAX1W5E4_PSEAJ|nr:hypothetical protein ALO60_102490 [Pseudomonas amygdali pv. tabaci]RML83379.1 hypothetical protein ALQ89_100983 [Pseudomonas amygdali pv. tabaci]RMR79033.1 hypothetical protein ALP77_102374 [Pseudomonas amygdali pv. tabaci]
MSGHLNGRSCFVDMGYPAGRLCPICVRPAQTKCSDSDQMVCKKRILFVSN